MATTQGVYGTVATITATLASLVTSTVDVGRETSAVDVSGASPPPVDYQAHFKITTGTSPTAGKQIEIWAVGSMDGTLWEAGATGADAALTATNTKPLMSLVRVIPVTATSNVTYTYVCKSIAAVFGGALPAKFSFFITHNTVANLHATTGNHEIKVRPINVASA